MKEIPVKQLIVNDVKPIKGMTHSCRPGFIIPVNLVLEDGRTIPTVLSSEKKKDLPLMIERTHARINQGQMFVNFDDNGQFWGTVTKFMML